MAGSPSLRRRAVLAVVGLAAVLVAAAAAALFAQARVDDATTRVTERALPALVAVERLQRAFVDQETGIRDYLLTGRAALLQPYQDAAASLDEQERVLRGALVDDPDALARLDAVLGGHRRWLAVAEPAIGLRARDDQAGLDDLVVRAPGPPLSAGLRDHVAGLRAAIEARIAADAARVRTVGTTLTWVLSGAVGLGVLGAGLAVLGVRRALSDPLGRLIDAVERVAEGDLDRPVPADGPAELAALGAAVDRMRTMLDEHRGAAVRAAAQRESDRVAADLHGGAVRRLFAVTTTLTSLGARHPELAADLARSVEELDRAIADVRAAAVGGPRSGAGAGHALAARVAEELARAPALAGVHPALHVGPRAAPDLPAHVEDHLLTALAATVEELTGAVRGPDDVEVELSITADRACLRLFVRGTAAWPKVARLPERSPSDATRCRILPAVGGRTVVEWAVAFAGAGVPAGTSAVTTALNEP
ncbi:CHASE3 domain-containing protein [Pseudonocardia humida]|uniref:CHASE3 domain-containing protein n=1 Tax=Pseudonocardia humida TaxID=2800819 RepID=A0ABT1A1X4_9PSEU|nr:CHASE3 domain-containing protein [Pseudonocardia humida]MCO1656992.1 CHASE3 domain-containing protein [Pseudonocardia humida]